MKVSRRALLVGGLVAGGGMGIAYVSHRLDDGDAAVKFGASTPNELPLNAFVKLSRDGRVTVAVHRAEMGQGVTTALPMLLAEEMDADLTQVSYEFAPNDRDYFNFGVMLRGRPLGPIEDRFWAATGTSVIREIFRAMGMSLTISSASVIDAWDTLRPAGAAARAMLLAAAAERWNTPIETLRTEPGRVIDPNAGRSLGYGELAAAAALVTPPSAPKLKSPASYRLVGNDLPRLDSREKALGKARFGIDVRDDAVLHAAVAMPPTAGGRVADFDDREAAQLPGVIGTQLLGDRAIAIFAKDSWTAMRAAKQVRITSAAFTGNASNWRDDYQSFLDSQEPSVFREEGDVEAPRPDHLNLMREYSAPFLAHACLEPMNCAARLEDGQLTVWAPTQAHSVARDVAASIAGLPPEAVTVERTLLGGGFGRRAEMDFVELAVAAAVARAGETVQLTYTREQDMQQDMYRPAAFSRLRGEINRQGEISSIDCELVTQSVVASYFQRTPTPRGGEAAADGSMASGASNMVYAIPNLRVRAIPAETGIPVGYWRSTGTSYNAFFVESFMDELAELANIDPLEFRLHHLAHSPKHKKVLETAAERGDWQSPLPAGRGRGVALTDSHGSVCAQVIEITLIDTTVRVDRVVCVLDCREVVHPGIVRDQLFSAINDGLASALTGRIDFDGEGVARQDNFDTYPLLRQADQPEMDIVLLPLGGRPGGVGEPGVPAVAPALAGAIYAAGGPRLRHLPLDNL